MCRVDWPEQAVRQLDKVDHQVRRTIGRFIADRVHGSDDHRSIGKPLRNERLWRYRIGDYRVLCHIGDDVLIVLVVTLGHRREVYR